MKIFHKDIRGFTLVELIMVMAILGVVVGALYSVYLTHLRNASHQDQLLEVQQNMRIAMDSISRDLMMAGMLVQSPNPPLKSTNPTSIVINTASADRVYARITHVNRTGVKAFPNLTTSVDAGSFLNFNAGDRVRIIRPSFSCGNSVTNEPLRCQFAIYSTMVVATPPATGVMSLQRTDGASFNSTLSLNQGDMIAKKGGYSSGPGPATPDTVYYYLAAGNGCSTGQSCLFRSVNGAVPGDIIAGYMQSLNFTYNSIIVAGASQIVSVGVKLIGTTTPAAGSGQLPVTREMDTLVKLRQ
jgi:prepilin-type N-terminal cleavage/methylation domain-containing protein